VIARFENGRFLARALAYLLLTGGMLPGGPTARAQSAADFKQWGTETLARIQRDYGFADDLYADEVVVGKPKSTKSAFMWGCGVQLSALAAAARLDRGRSLTTLRHYVDALDSYWGTYKGHSGYGVLPTPSPPDHFYDDNAWMILALAETYEITRDPQDLRRAEQTYRFVLSGEDDKLGGGIYWHESDKNSKNTCSNAPNIVAGLRLYQLTHRAAYLEPPRRLYAWINAHLQDTDGLYFDNIRMDGSIDKTKWTYNTALMLRANSLFYAITQEKRYLDEAQRIAHAAEAHWVRPETGAIAEGGWFAHLLCEAFLSLYDQDKDAHWLQLVRRAVGYVHDHVRDPNGYYAVNWSTPQTIQQEKVPLLNEASAARAFLVVARYP
jgi:rhamnogalacturonyl hydrolase YesR